MKRWLALAVLTAAVSPAKADEKKEPACYADGLRECHRQVKRMSERVSGLRQQLEEKCEDDVDAEGCVMLAIERHYGYDGDVEEMGSHLAAWQACETDRSACEPVGRALLEGRWLERDKELGNELVHEAERVAKGEEYFVPPVLVTTTKRAKPSRSKSREGPCYVGKIDDCRAHVEELRDAVARATNDEAERRQRLAWLLERYEDMCEAGLAAEHCVYAAIMWESGLGASKDTTKAGLRLGRACRLDKRACSATSGIVKRTSSVGEPAAVAAAEEILATDGDGANAAELYEIACDRADAQACAKAAVLHDRGSHTLVRDRKRAYRLFRLACDLDRSTCIDIAYAYKRGENVGRDKRRAATFRKLALQREGDASCRYGDPDRCVTNAYAFMDGKHVERDAEYATKLFEEACEAGAATGCTGLAEVHLKRGEKSDGGKAVELFERACKDDEATACWKLGRLYLRGEEIKQDTKRAEKLFARACDLGDQAGCRYMEKKP